MENLKTVRFDAIFMCLRLLQLKVRNYWCVLRSFAHGLPIVGLCPGGSMAAKPAAEGRSGVEVLEIRPRKLMLKLREFVGPFWWQKMSQGCYACAGVVYWISNEHHISQVHDSTFHGYAMKHGIGHIWSLSRLGFCHVLLGWPLSERLHQQDQDAAASGAVCCPEKASFG